MSSPRILTCSRRLTRHWAVFCLLMVSARHGQAATTWNVSNSSDTGSGSLRKAVDSSVSGDTISWTTGSGGPVFLGTDLSGIKANTTLDVTGAPSAVTISSNSIPLAGAVTFRNNNTSYVWDITSKISDSGGAGSLIKTGVGELDLSGPNSYSGGTTLTAGTLGVKSNTALGSGTLTYNGGILQLGSGVNAANDILLNAGGTFDTAGNNATLSGVISEGVSGSSLTKVGAGTLFLTGANSYTGGTFINAGTLSINADAALGTSSITFNGGTLQAGANSISSARALTLNAGGGTFDANGYAATLSGAVNGAGGLTLRDNRGGGVLTLTNVGNGYSGGTTLYSGTLSIDNDSELGNGSGGITFYGGTLQANNTHGATGLTSGRTITLNGSGTFDANGLNSNLSGLISGTGDLTIADSAGGGKVTLSNAGANTSLGGTTLNAGVLSVANDNNLGDLSGALTFNGGTLQTTLGIGSARNISLAGNGAIDTDAAVSTFTGVISGGGALTIAGGGTLFLANANTYSGGTVLDGGTIAVSSSPALGSGQLIFNGAGTLRDMVGITFASSITLNANAIGTFDIMGNTTTLSGVIGGAGSLVLASTGTLALTGANTYTGGTLVTKAGVLSINNGSAVGTSTLTLDHGTLQTAAALSLANNVALGHGGGTLDAYGQMSTFSGVFADSTTGSGSLTIADTIGGGTIVLTATNTYSGGTFINGGTLQLGASNALPSTVGTLTVNPGGTFNMASFTQTVASFSVAGTLQMMLQPQSKGANLTVTGTADVSHGTLVVGLTPQVAQTIKDGVTTFIPITAGSPVTGALASIVSPAALSFSSPTTNGTDLTLTAHFVPFAHSAINPNQAAIGKSLELLRTSPTGDIATVIGNLYTLDAPHLQSALDQIGPISLAAMGSLGMAGSGVQAAAVGQRLAALADGTAPDGVTNYTVSGHMDAPGGPLLAYAGSDLDSLELGAVHELPASKSPWGFYASGVGSTGRLSEATTDSGLQPGYAFNTAGLAGGGDYRLNKNLAVGGSLSYLHGHASVYAPGSGTVDNNSARFGVYAAAHDETARASLYIGGASDYFSTKRGIQFGQISRVAAASPQGSEFNLDASASFDVKTRAWGTFSPFAGLDYNRLMIGSFAESGADALDLNVSPQTALSLQSSLGLRYSDKIPMDSWMFLPYMSAGWRHEFEDQSRPIEAQLASGAGSVFSVATGRYARDGALFGTGFALDWGKGLTAKFDYAGDFRSHFQDSSYNATLRYKF